MVSRCAGGGRNTVAEGAFQSLIVHRHQPAAGAGSTASAAAAATASTTAAAVGGSRGGRRRGDEGRHVLLPLSLLGCVVLLFHLDNLIQEGRFLLFKLILKLFQILRLCQQLQNQGIRLITLGIQLLLGGIQLVFCVLKFCLLPFQLLPGNLNILGSLPQLLQAALVGGCNLLHHVHPIQQIGEAVGTEQNLPVGHGAVLLHGADTILVQIVQVFIPLLCMIQLILLVGNEDIVGRNLLVDVQ